MDLKLVPPHYFVAFAAYVMLVSVFFLGAALVNNFTLFFCNLFFGFPFKLLFFFH
jgi:hypothetical protein